jgi:hypothetical protein
MASGPSSRRSSDDVVHVGSSEVEVQFNGGWYPAKPGLIVDAGQIFRFSDGTTTTISPEELLARVRSPSKKRRKSSEAATAGKRYKPIFENNRPSSSSSSSSSRKMSAVVHFKRQWSDTGSPEPLTTSGGCCGGGGNKKATAGQRPLLRLYGDSNSVGSPAATCKDVLFSALAEELAKDKCAVERWARGGLTICPCVGSQGDHQWMAWYEGDSPSRRSAGPSQHVPADVSVIMLGTNDIHRFNNLSDGASSSSSGGGEYPPVQSGKAPPQSHGRIKLIKKHLKALVAELSGGGQKKEKKEKQPTQKTTSRTRTILVPCPYRDKPLLAAAVRTAIAEVAREVDGACLLEPPADAKAKAARDVFRGEDFFDKKEYTDQAHLTPGAARRLAKAIADKARECLAE